MNGMTLNCDIKDTGQNLAPFIGVVCADAKKPILSPSSVDLIVTSPAYWQKRDYGHKKQIGWELTPRKYVKTITAVFEGLKGVLKTTGSLYVNVGDSFENGRLLEIPSLIATSATKSGWILRQRIIWHKPNGTPHSARRRLASREEYVLHFTLSDNYFSDLEGYKEKYGSVSNVWRIPPAQQKGEHLAPFPSELVERILTLGCPKSVCVQCGSPFKRVVEKTAELDVTRPQAKRAMQIARESGLSTDHIAAIQAVGISDAGKAIKYQNGAGRNGERITALAKEAKEVLGGYFREFTFAKKRTIAWKGCPCAASVKPGLVYDPFVGTGTTIRVASRLGFSAIGSDLNIYTDLKNTLINYQISSDALENPFALQ